MNTFENRHRIGYAGGMHKTHRKRADPGCATGGFYKSPTTGQTIESGSNFDISWDTSCLTADAVDIYLYAPGSSVSRIHLWQNVNFALGTFATELQAGWWNSSGSISLQLSIVESGSPPFLATLPAGPVFSATVGASDSGTAVVSTIENVNNFNTSKGGLSGGKIAAAVILPLLVVGGLIFTAWLKLNRAKTEVKTKRYSEAIDKRMSTISTDWKSITPGGASAAIRNSISVSGTGGNRNSAFSFGNIRPASTVGLDGGQAGIGSKNIYIQENGSFEQPQMSQLRSGPRIAAAGGERVPRISFAEGTRASRVSFATDTRPSVDSRRGVSRAFHVGEAPPLPTPHRQDSSEISPTQTQGPFSLSPEDIHARMSGQETRPSMDEYMPALSMMRHGGQQEADSSDLLFTPQEPDMPTPPTPTMAKPGSTGAMPMQPMPANVMSPDQMLRAYAESRRNTGAPVNSGLAFPSPAASSYDGNGMRTLYSPPPSDTATPNPYRKSRAVSEYSRYDDEDAYMGTAN